jgi:trehalose synthase-fused probable maltokinase
VTGEAPRTGLSASLDPSWLTAQRWFAGKGRRIGRIEQVAAIAPFLAVVEVEVDDEVQRYSLPAGQVWPSLLAAAHARPQGGFELDWRGGEMPGSERELESDQSNTSSVLDERLVLKCYRRLWPGAHPEAELVEQLTGRTPVVPAFRGSLLLRDPDGTVWPVALVQDYVAGARDGWEWSQELIGRALAGAPSEETTGFARPLGRAIAQLHTALAQLGGRPAAVDDARRWHAESLAQLERALAAVDDDTAKAVRGVESRIRADLGLFAGIGMLTRVHGDLHVGQVLFSPAGLHVIDFEGEPTRSPAERRALQSPVRDVASMLRSFDHVPRWVLRDAVDADDRLVGEAWAARVRADFLDGYGELAPPLDPTLLRAFEVEKETYELVYAASFLPEWMPIALASLVELAEASGP